MNVPNLHWQHTSGAIHAYVPMTVVCFVVCCRTRADPRSHIWNKFYVSLLNNTTFPNTRWMHDIVRWAWSSARAEHGAVTCIWLSSECDWTSGHRISPKSTRALNRNWEWGLAIKHAAYRLVRHTLQVLEMAWTDDSTPFTCATGSLHHAVVRSIVSMLKVQWIQHWNRESGNKGKGHRQIAMWLLLGF